MDEIVVVFVLPTVIEGAVPASVRVLPVNVSPTLSLIPLRVTPVPNVSVCAVPPMKYATSAFVNVYAAAAPKPLIVVPLSEATMIEGEEALTQNAFVVSQAAAPVAPVPAVAPFWSKKMLAARALGGAPTERRAAAAKRHAREINFGERLRFI